MTYYNWQMNFKQPQSQNFTSLQTPSFNNNFQAGPFAYGQTMYAPINWSGANGITYQQPTNTATSRMVNQLKNIIGGNGFQPNNTTQAISTQGSSINPITEGSSASGMGKASNIAAIAGAASDMLGSFMPEKTEYAGDKGNITSTMDDVYDGISDAMMSIPGWGTLVGGIMKGGKLLGQGVNALGGGTSGMTTTDAVLGSSFFNLTPLGLINGFGGATTNTITKDQDAFATVGGSYTGSSNTLDDAVNKSGKKYGLLSRNAMGKANDEIAEASRQQSIIQDISQDVNTRNTLQQSMSAINTNKRRMQLSGGYDQASVRVGKQGMQIGTTIHLVSPEFKEGGSIIKLISDISEFKEGGSIKKPELSIDDIKDYNTFYEYLKQSQRTDPDYDYESFYNDPESYAQWIDLERKTPGKAPMSDYYKKPTHYTYSIESKGGKDFGGQWIGSDEVGWTFKASPFNMAQHTFEEMKDYWDKNEPNAVLWYGDQFYKVKNDPSSFKNGGTVNVIPEGALHARKHNLDIDNITNKGIPVISESKEGKIEQQAEIEVAEIILRLEVTKKLEKLYKTYYAEDSSQKEKDEAALKAGTLLVYEILHNTQDNVGLL